MRWSLVRELVALPGPPGQEGRVREAVAAHADRLGCARETDARGNLLLSLPGAGRIPAQPDIVVMAHLDEIALLVVRVGGRRAAGRDQSGRRVPVEVGRGSRADFGAGRDR